jgi:hypothetical protein
MAAIYIYPPFSFDSFSCILTCSRMIPHPRSAKRLGTAQLEGGKRKKPGELYGTSLNGQQQSLGSTLEFFLSRRRRPCLTSFQNLKT